MKIFLKRTVYPACLLFTLICLLFSALLSWSGGEMYAPTINISNLCQILAFSIVVSFANLLFSLDKLPYLVAFLAHFLCTMLSAWVIFLVIGQHLEEGSAFNLVLFFAVIYIAIAVPVIIVHTVRKTIKREPRDYKRQF